MGRKAGDVLGGFVLQERAGGGPSSEIWRAVRHDGRTAAVRFFLGGRDVPPLRVSIDELRALDHPNIARTAELNLDGEHPHLLREWVPGASIEGRSLTHAEAAQVLEALAFAHARGVVHGRLGPSNVLASGDGRVKVSDFGMAGSAAEVGADLRALGALLPAGDPWGSRLRAGDFGTAAAALAARPAAPAGGMPSWVAGPLLIVGVFFVAYVALGFTMAGLQPSLRLIAGAAGAGLCALAWRRVERPLAAAVFWGALLWGFGARGLLPAALGAAAVAVGAGWIWLAGARKA